MKRIMLFTYDDLDGASCAILAKLAYGNNIDIEYCNYNNADEKINKFIENKAVGINCEHSFMYIVGIPLKDTTAKEIDKLYHFVLDRDFDKSIKLIDYHKTALNKYEWTTIQVDKSGTLLFYECLSYNVLNKCKSLDDLVNTLNYFIINNKKKER